MPHLRLEYPAALAEETDIAGLCERLRLALIETGLFPTAGIRVRAYAADAHAMTDGDPADRFLALQMTVGEGRTEADLHAAGAHVFAAARAFLAPVIAGGRLALSLDIGESRKTLSFKDNPIHGRIGREA